MQQGAQQGHQQGSLPPEVSSALQQYVQVLATSRSLDELTTRFGPMAGGTLVFEDGRLRETVTQMPLKKDWNNVRFYRQPPEVTRVDVTAQRTHGHGPSALTGTEFKVWIGKVDPSQGMPAPITLLVAEGQRGARVVGVGSL